MPQSILALYQREALLRDSRSLREDSRSLCGQERSVVRPDFAECESKIVRHSPRSDKVASLEAEERCAPRNLSCANAAH